MESSPSFISLPFSLGSDDAQLRARLRAFAARIQAGFRAACLHGAVRLLRRLGRGELHRIGAVAAAKARSVAYVSRHSLVLAFLLGVLVLLQVYVFIGLIVK